jgi:hypothetical protein
MWLGNCCVDDGAAGLALVGDVVDVAADSGVAAADVSAASAMVSDVDQVLLNASASIPSSVCRVGKLCVAGLFYSIRRGFIA